jgi:hypothetical protein
MKQYTQRGIYYAGLSAVAASAATLLQVTESHDLPPHVRERWHDLERYTKQLADEICDLALKEVASCSSS